MESALDEVNTLITQAKRLRDRERFAEVIEVLEDEAIPLIEDESVGADATYKLELGRRLADCHGIVGGCYRRWALKEPPGSGERAERLLKSVESYQKGQEVEEDEQYGIVSTYNVLNRVISQILLDPLYLSDPSAAPPRPGLKSLDARADLERVEQRIEAQSQRDDSWLLADKALVRLLLGRDGADPKDAYQQFLSPERVHPYFVYESMLATLRPLAELDGFERPVAESLREAVRLLEARLSQMQQ